MWGAIGTIAGSVISGLLNNQGVDSANNANIRLWREQSEYNKPINQLARLTEAGLNPNLIYGSGGVQNTISSAPKMESSRWDLDMSKLGALFAHQQLKTADNNNQLLEDRHSLNQERLKALRTENEYREQELDLLRSSGLLRNDPALLKETVRSGQWLLRKGEQAFDFGRRTGERVKGYFTGNKNYEDSNLDYTANPYPPVVYKNYGR